MIESFTCFGVRSVVKRCCNILTAASTLHAPSSQVLINKRPQTAHPRIHAREPSKRAPSAPAHSANHGPLVVHNGASAVSLARVLAARLVPGAHHVLGDVFGRGVRCVGGHACLARDDGDVDSAQRRGRFGGVLGVAPAYSVSYGGWGRGRRPGRTSLLPWLCCLRQGRSRRLREWRM